MELWLFFPIALVVVIVLSILAEVCDNNYYSILGTTLKVITIILIIGIIIGGITYRTTEYTADSYDIVSMREDLDINVKERKMNENKTFFDHDFILEEKLFGFTKYTYFSYVFDQKLHDKKHKLDKYKLTR